MTAYESALQLVKTTCLGVAPADESLQPVAKATRDLDMIRGWADEFAGANFVVPSGQKFNFLALEIDELDFPKVAHRFETLPISWRTQRRPGLTQVWLQAAFPPPMAIRRGPLLDKLFILPYAPVPGSQINGSPYNWVPGCSPSETKCEWLPASWRGVLRTSAHRPNSPRPFLNSSAPPEFDPSQTGRWNFDDDEY